MKGISHEVTEFYGGLRRTYACDEQEPLMKKKKQVGNRKSLVRLLNRMDQSRRQKNLLSTSYLDMLITAQLSEDSPAVLSQEKFCEDHVFSNESTENNYAH